VALNSSGIYTGQAVGAALGGWLLANDASAWMSWVGLGLVLIAIALSVIIDRSNRATGMRAPA
jgi:predicted MFS family arabinose efflux permease